MPNKISKMFYLSKYSTNFFRWIGLSFKKFSIEWSSVQSLDDDCCNELVDGHESTAASSWDKLCISRVFASDGGLYFATPFLHAEQRYLLLSAVLNFHRCASGNLRKSRIFLLSAVKKMEIMHIYEYFYIEGIYIYSRKKVRTYEMVVCWKDWNTF